MAFKEPKEDAQEPNRPCPVCGEPMAIEQVFQTQIDVCEGHGLWLDEGELESIVSRLRSNRKRIKEAAARSARNEGKILGWLLGPLAFLFD